MQGIKVTKPGKDASSTDPRDFTIHSEYNILKIAQEKLDSHTFDSLPQEWFKTISHNLGYKPVVLFYLEHPGSGEWALSPAVLEYKYPAEDFDNYISFTYSHLTDNSIQLHVSVSTEAPTPFVFRYKYYILVEPRKDAWYE